jgi:hypothetical protein
MKRDWPKRRGLGDGAKHRDVNDRGGLTHCTKVQKETVQVPPIGGRTVVAAVSDTFRNKNGT